MADKQATSVFFQLQVLISVTYFSVTVKVTVDLKDTADRMYKPRLSVSRRWLQAKTKC